MELYLEIYVSLNSLNSNVSQTPRPESESELLFQ